jgi:hypothetical protein
VGRKEGMRERRRGGTGGEGRKEGEGREMGENSYGSAMGQL